MLYQLPHLPHVHCDLAWIGIPRFSSLSLQTLYILSLQGVTSQNPTCLPMTKILQDAAIYGWPKKYRKNKENVCDKV